MRVESSPGEREREPKMCSGTEWGERGKREEDEGSFSHGHLYREKKHLWIWARSQDREGKWWSPQAPPSSGGPPSSSWKGWVSSTSFPTGSPGASQPGSGPAVPSSAGLAPMLSLPPTPRQPWHLNSCLAPPGLLPQPAPTLSHVFSGPALRPSVRLQHGPGEPS